jgi:uracil-DNA glycosylase
VNRITLHQAELRACTRCPDMQRPVVLGSPVASEILLIGQAPGDKEPLYGRPFAWTAGKQLFKWFAALGVDETAFRARVYMAAVCRCFPGKQPGGGDRVPTRDEIANCRPWLERELALLRPRLVIPVGRLAIEQLLAPAPLAEHIGRVHRLTRDGRRCDVLPLPHPSGASTWFRTEPGRTLLEQALARLGAHPAWVRLRRSV